MFGQTVLTLLTLLAYAAMGRNNFLNSKEGRYLHGEDDEG